MNKWKAAEAHQVKGFWFMRVTHLHPRLQKLLQEGVQPGNVPEGMTKGSAVLIQKRPSQMHSDLELPSYNTPSYKSWN